MHICTATVTFSFIILLVFTLSFSLYFWLLLLSLSPHSHCCRSYFLLFLLFSTTFSPTKQEIKKINNKKGWVLVDEPNKKTNPISEPFQITGPRELDADDNNRARTPTKTIATFLCMLSLGLWESVGSGYDKYYSNNSREKNDDSSSSVFLFFPKKIKRKLLL